MMLGLFLAAIFRILHNYMTAHDTRQSLMKLN
jgi:hypothetical protein